MCKKSKFLIFAGFLCGVLICGMVLGFLGLVVLCIFQG